MKKIALIVAALLVLFASCAPQQEDSVRVVVPNGAPAFVFSQMMSEDAQFDGYKISYEVVSGAAGLQAKINDFDLAILPTNMAANLYNQGIDIQLVSVNVHGTLYLVGRQEIEGLDGLKGKVVYNIGKGQTPDITFKHLLGRALPLTEGEVTLKYVNEGAEIMPLLISGQAEYAIIGEPQVTQALENTKSSASPLRIILDIQQKWKTETGKEYPQAALVGKKDFLQRNSALVEKILEKISGAADWLKAGDANRQAAREAIANNSEGTIQIPPILEQTVERSNIRTDAAQDSKAALEAYYEVLMGINNGAPIGGKLPDDGFYYNAQ